MGPLPSLEYQRGHSAELTGELTWINCCKLSSRSVHTVRLQNPEMLPAWGNGDV